MPLRLSSLRACSPFLLALLAAVPLAACGGSATGGTGGTGGSASTSTSTATGSGGAIPEARVILRDHAGRPAIGVDVLVHDPKGATTQQTKTDKTGAAYVDLVLGGGVTALWKVARENSAPDYRAVSVMGLPKGAEVRLVADPDVSTEVPAPMSLTFTGVPPLVASGWDIVASCHEDTMSSETAFAYGGCPGSATYDLVAFLAGGDQRLVFAAQPSQPGQSVPFQLDPGKAEAAPQLAVDVQGAPDGTTAIEANLIANRKEGGRTQLDRSHSLNDPQGTMIKVPRLPVSPEGNYDLEVYADTSSGFQAARLPFAAAELPTSPVVWAVSPVGFVLPSGAISGSSARPEVPWALVPGASPVDSVRVVLSYFVPDPAPATPDLHGVTWTIYTPSSITGTAHFPEIPGSFAGFTAPPQTQFVLRTEQVDVPGTDSILAAVNSEFDRKGSSWSSKTVNAAAP